jgi:hypothetical protein
MESNRVPEKRQTATNLESGYNGNNEGERSDRNGNLLRGTLKEEKHP